MSSQRLDSYVRHSVNHGHSTIEGDFEAANAAYDCLQQVFEEVVKNSEGDSLFGLYEHEDPWTQSWAASHTLEIDQARALTKLEQLERANIPHVSTSAKYTIQGWKAGALRFWRYP